jgi:hypothetical protein
MYRNFTLNEKWRTFVPVFGKENITVAALFFLIITDTVLNIKSEGFLHQKRAFRRVHGASRAARYVIFYSLASFVTL